MCIICVETEEGFVLLVVLLIHFAVVICLEVKLLLLDVEEFITAVATIVVIEFDNDRGDCATGVDLVMVPTNIQ